MYRTLAIVSASLGTRSASTGDRALRTSSLALASLATFGLLAVSAGSASAIGFMPPYGPADFTLTTDGGDGSVDTSGAPNSIILTGSDTITDMVIDTDYRAVAVGTGMVSFDWNYETNDTNGPQFDPFGYVLNGVFTQLTDNMGAVMQMGSASFMVAVNDIFGFRIHSTDDRSGRASATISNFSAPVPEPGAATVFTLGLGVVGFAVRRRRFQLAEGNLAS